jgi:Flp pilus assembly pilin Flp
MRQRLCAFWQEEDGQDLIEYTLLITFIALATMWIMGSGQPAVNQIWQHANTTISTAHGAAGGS